jgi:hypothetical protein
LYSLRWFYESSPFWRSTDSASSLISLLEIKRPLTPNPVARFDCRSRAFVVKNYELMYQGGFVMTSMPSQSLYTSNCLSNQLYSRMPKLVRLVKATRITILGNTNKDGQDPSFNCCRFVLRDQTATKNKNMVQLTFSRFNYFIHYRLQVY